MIDIHTHILPHMDDGAKDSATALRMLDMSIAQGVETVVFSPHYYGKSRSPQKFLEARGAMYEHIRARIPEGIKTRLAAEVHFTGVNSIDEEEMCSLAIEGTEYLLVEFPFTTAVMIGRGLIANPALAQEMNGGAPLTKEALRTFLNSMLDEYQQRYQKSLTLGRMREVLKHVACCFENPQKPRKAIRKASTIEQLSAAADALLDLPLTENPGYDAFIYKGGNF